MMAQLGNEERKGRLAKVAATAGITVMVLSFLMALVTAGGEPWATAFIAGSMLIMYALAVWTLWLESGEEKPAVVKEDGENIKREPMREQA